jgi:hypothetical protein
MQRLGAPAERSGAPPLDIEPRLDTERAPKPKSEREPDTLVESYDAFNDRAYAGPAVGKLPPMLGRPAEKKEGDAESPPPRKEYRHGGVRRDDPVVTGRASEKPVPRNERSEPAASAQGFGVQREQEPAWARLGLEPDPRAPGVYRDPLTGAAVAPPSVHSRRTGTVRPSVSRRSRPPLIAVLATVGGLLAVGGLALRFSSAARLSIQFGRPRADATSATPGTLEVRSATTTTPVDVAVPPQPAAGVDSALEEPRVCGQVLDATGRPVPGALLTVAGTMAQVRSDAHGRFCLAAPTGTRLVEVVDPRGAGTATRNIRIDFAAGAPAARVVLP